MKKQKLSKNLALIGAMLGTSLTIMGCNENNKINYKFKVDLGDNGELLSNPGMGWDFCYYSNRTEAYGATVPLDDTLDYFPCDTVFFRLGWKYFQPEKDRFDFSIVDKVVDTWVKKGKRIAFCWEICSPNTMDGQSCPLWLRDECGAQGVEYELYEESRKYGFEFGEKGVKTWVPDYDDPVFLKYFRAFLDEAARRYDGKDYLEFIEVGSIGTWGEGHNHMSWPAKIYPEVILTHLQMYRDAFPNSTVLVNDDLVNNRPSAIALSKELEFGCVDDGVLVPDTGLEGGRYANKDVFDEFWQDTVCAIEHHPGTLATQVYYDSLWMSHASYCRLHNDPNIMKRQSGNYVDMMTKRMGYRMSVNSVELSSFKAGDKGYMRVNMMNTGVAPMYKGGYLKAYIKDETGNVVTDSTSIFNLRNLEVYEDITTAPNTPIEITFNLPNDMKGKYTIHIAVVNANGEPYVNIPLDNGENKIYKVATINM